MDYTAQLAILKAMTPLERKHHFQSEVLQMEESQLETMIKSLKETDEQVEFFTRKAKSAYSDYEQYNDESRLEIAEQYVELAQEIKDSRYKLIEIREQRERIQCQRKLVSEIQMRIKETSTERPNSSGHSTS